MPEINIQGKITTPTLRKDDLGIIEHDSFKDGQLWE